MRSTEAVTCHCCRGMGKAGPEPCDFCHGLGWYVPNLDELRFAPTATSRPKPGLMTVETTLEHFTIITHFVDPAALRKHLHPRFEPISVPAGDRGPQALISVVTFFDRDFRFTSFPWVKNHFGQTNYRAYVIDTLTGEHVAWFFGTSLASLAVVVPRLVWRLPWHRARMSFDCRFDPVEARYERLAVKTESRWAPADFKVEDTGRAPEALPGFKNLEAGLFLLTQPTRGVFFRNDRSLGGYSIWHDRMRPTVGAVRSSRHRLLADLGLVGDGDCSGIQSVLIQRRIDFTIYLPPRRIGTADANR